MTNINPPPTLQDSIHSCPWVFPVYLQCLTSPFRWLQPQLVETATLRLHCGDSSSRGGNRANTWQLFSQGCPPLSALTRTVDTHSWHTFASAVTPMGTTPSDQDTRGLLGVATPTPIAETAQQAQQSRLWKISPAQLFVVVIYHDQALTCLSCPFVGGEGSYCRKGADKCRQ